MVKNDKKVFNDIAQLTAVNADVTLKELLGRKRDRRLLIPRMVIANILNVELSYNKQDIADYLNRDRTSVYYYMNEHTSNYKYWSEYRELYDIIKAGYLGINNATMTLEEMNDTISKSDIVSNPENSRFMICFKIGTAETYIYTNKLEHTIALLKELFSEYNFIFKVEHRNSWSYAI